MSPASLNALVASVVAQLALPAARTSTLTGTGVDCLDYEGVGVVTLHSAKGTGNADNTLIVTLEESDASGSGYAAISGATFSTVLGTGGVDVLEDLPIDFKIRKRYIRAIGTIAGTTPSFVFGISLRGMKQYR
jgi:hypothetical protein